jgi:hypothetical protein
MNSYEKDADTMTVTGTNLPNKFLDTNHLLGGEFIDGALLSK